MNDTTTARFVPFAYGFRPFFLLAGWYALIAIAAWLFMYRAGASPLGGLPPQLWHGHEMLYGFIGATITGFMLTAVPSWTGGRGFAGPPLVALTVVWLLGRLAFFAAGVLPLGLVAVAELAFLPAVAVLIAPSLLRTSNRNLPLLIVLLALWLTDAVFLYAVARADVLLASGALRTALDIVLLLITVIGGRIVPSFTANALRRSGWNGKLGSRAGVERGVIAAMLALLIVDTLLPHHWLAGAVALAAGLLQLLRLSGWQGFRTLSEPLVWVLHAAYLWLPVGLLLKAAWQLGGLGFAAHWLHALGAGAAATMILAVMTRASLGHTGRPLVAPPAIAVAYALLIAAVLVRVFGPVLLPGAYLGTVVTAGLLWLVAFLLYVIVYTPILLRPRADGRPG